MFNAYYSGANSVPVPGRDVRFNNIVIDGDIESKSSIESLSVKYEDGTSENLDIEFKKVGDLVYMYLYEISHTGAIYSQPFRDFDGIPSEYLPVSGETNGQYAQSIPVISNINSVKYSGYCYIAKTGILRLYFKVDHSLPTNNVPVASLAQVLCWSVSI